MNIDELFGGYGMKKMKYIIVWILPFVLFCICGYNFVRSEWINLTEIEAENRLNGLGYFIIGLIHVPLFIVFSIIALVLTIRMKKKKSK